MVQAVVLRNNLQWLQSDLQGSCHERVRGVFLLHGQHCCCVACSGPGYLSAFRREQATKFKAPFCQSSASKHLGSICFRSSAFFTAYICSS